MNEQITEGNKLIAEFMGAEVRIGYQSIKRTDYTVAGGFVTEYQKDQKYQTGGCQGQMMLERCAYNSSWDWLMPVVEKCHKIQREMELARPEPPEERYKQRGLDDPSGWRSWNYRHVSLSTDIVKVYNSTVRFIQWYNKTSEDGK